MPITKAALLEKRRQLEQGMTDLQAKVNAQSGAMQMVDQLIYQVDAEEAEAASVSEPDAIE